MLALIVTLCVVGQPLMCHVEHQYAPPGVSLAGCPIAGLLAFASRIPRGYVVREFHCEFLGAKGAA